MAFHTSIIPAPQTQPPLPWRFREGRPKVCRAEHGDERFGGATGEREATEGEMDGLGGSLFTHYSLLLLLSLYWMIFMIYELIFLFAPI